MAEPTLIIADAVAAAINGNSEAWGVEFTAQRLYVPRWELAELEELQVVVVPRTKSIERNDRVRGLEEPQIEIGIQQKVPDLTNETLDVLSNLADAIEVYVRTLILTVGSQKAIWKRTEYLAYAERELLAKRKVFTTVFAVAWNCVR